ncbi:MAG: MBL fold metallo-hydrolase [Spirochaetes bacterium]|nr:MBL fold metallo-hydrolase [Spirochaetota bacterium]
MQLTFLGTGSAFNPEMGNTAAYFVSGERLFLLDCGETVFSMIRDLPTYRACDEVFVLLTHLHADHVGSLGSLITYSYYVTGKKVAVLHPVDSILRLLDLLGIERSWYGFENLRAGTETDLGGGLAATPIEVDHVPAMPCFGYLISDGSSRIWYSGDAKKIPARILEGLADGSIDRIYQDTGGGDREDPAHAGLAYLEAAIPPSLRSRVICMHLDSDYAELLVSKGFRVADAR